MDAHATVFAFDSQSNLAAVTVPTAPPSSPAKQLLPHQRQDLAVQVLAGTEPVSDLAREHQVSRKFLYQQADTAQQALQQAFSPPSAQDRVLFYLPVTKEWLRQLILALVLVCHSPYRSVLTLLRDLFDWKVSLGTVHNVVTDAVAKARPINQQYDLSPVSIGAHDEIFQATKPVLVGVDTKSTYAYLLSLEDHRDGDTWGVRLLELADRGFAPDAIVGDGGSGLRSGQRQALPEVPFWGDHFHIINDLNDVLRFLENRAYGTIDAYERLQRKLARLQRKGESLDSGDDSRRSVQLARDVAIRLYDDVALLVNWLRNDIFAVAGPCYADRRTLYDFVVAELEARAPLCPHRLQPICQTLKNQRDTFLAFALELDEELELLAMEFQVSTRVLRGLLLALSRDDADSRRWTEEAAARASLGSRFREARDRLTTLAEETVRASSLVENLNSRLRGYFFLRRQLGQDYLVLLQFFLNHRVLERSDRPERAGKTPAQLLTGKDHPHWLEMLGYTRFQRN